MTPPTVITEAEADNCFHEGLNAAEIEENSGKKETCPYAEGDPRRKWWSRGYSYVFRLLRALKAEIALREALDRAP